MNAHVYQISVSKGGVPKLAVAQANIGPQGVEGDRQRNQKVHGGPDRAVCLYSLELIEHLQDEGHPIQPGSTGENLTLAGFEAEDWIRFGPGTRFQIGEVVLEVTSYTAPCKNIAASFVDGEFTRMSTKTHPGWSRLYARVLQGGPIQSGDPVQVLHEGGA